VGDRESENARRRRHNVKCRGVEVRPLSLLVLEKNVILSI
jgi:hypothetical protein